MFSTLPTYRLDSYAVVPNPENMAVSDGDPGNRRVHTVCTARVFTGDSRPRASRRPKNAESVQIDYRPLAAGAHLDRRGVFRNSLSSNVEIAGQKYDPGAVLVTGNPGSSPSKQPVVTQASLISYRPSLAQTSVSIDKADKNGTVTRHCKAR